MTESRDYLELYSRERKNILELYLRDVFEKECEFKINADEKEFIQTGVETIVTNLAQKVLEDDPMWNDIEKEMTLYESDGGKIIKADGEILKVGSFYEGTKNNFPDEFDMIACFYHCQEETCMDRMLTKRLLKILSLTVEVIRKKVNDFEKSSSNKTNISVTSVNGKRKIYFDEYIGKTQPAMTMNFMYENETSEKKVISVDFVPAAVIKVHNLREFVDKCCTPEQFREEIMQTGTILMVHKGLTVTQTEVHVMQDLLSENHKKVYRLLKYFFNGNDEDYGPISHRLDIKAHSSYMLKSMLIFHHYKCTNPILQELSECTLDILNEISKHENEDTFPKLLSIQSYTSKSGKKLFLLNEVKKMKDQFTSMMQSPAEEYKYENYRMKMSITGTFLQKCRHYYLPADTEADDGEMDEDLQPLYPLFSEEFYNYLP